MMNPLIIAEKRGIYRIEVFAGGNCRAVCDGVVRHWDSLEMAFEHYVMTADSSKSAYYICKKLESLKGRGERFALLAGALAVNESQEAVQS